MKSLVMPIIGLPNVGKSTIINALMGHKVSIVTHKKHTTRSLIMASKSLDDAEILFVDTPGIEKVSTKLGTVIFSSMKEYLASLDQMLLILDAAKPEIEKFEEIIPKSIVVLNKIDRVHKPKLLPIIAQLQAMGAKEVFLISANIGDGLKELANYLEKYVETGHQTKDGSLYAEDLVAYACECIREKILIKFEKEIPYKIWVQPKSSHVPEKSAWKIILQIVVPKKGYKPILLGKRGENMKAIGTAARIELSSKFKQPGYLGLEIIVDEKLWQKDYVYQQLGWKR